MLTEINGAHSLESLCKVLDCGTGVAVVVVSCERGASRGRVVSGVTETELRRLADTCPRIPSGRGGPKDDCFSGGKKTARGEHKIRGSCHALFPKIAITLFRAKFQSNQRGKDLLKVSTIGHLVL